MADTTLSVPRRVNTNATIFVVDDDAAVKDSLCVLLESAGYKVEAFGSGKEFLETSRVAGNGCLVLDLHLPWMTGLEVLEYLDRNGIELPAILITGRSDPELRERARRANAVALLDKPVRQELLLETIDRALGRLT